MKLTKETLRRIIKEELEATMEEGFFDFLKKKEKPQRDRIPSEEERTVFNYDYDDYVTLSPEEYEQYLRDEKKAEEEDAKFKADEPDYYAGLNHSGVPTPADLKGVKDPVEFIMGKVAGIAQEEAPDILRLGRSVKGEAGGAYEGERAAARMAKQMGVQLSPEDIKRAGKVYVANI